MSIINSRLLIYVPVHRIFRYKFKFNLFSTKEKRAKVTLKVN